MAEHSELLAEALVHLRAINAQLERLLESIPDAARYRWLRDQWDRAGVLDGVMFSKSSDGEEWVGAEVLDRRIDAAAGVKEVPRG